MNYLAHFHLSNNDKDLIIGNYIADDVKGNEFLKYNLSIQKGILLHRKIDTFTDTHHVVTRSKDTIRHHQNKYTPVVMDVFYDYFLAKTWHLYSKGELLKFTKNIYKILLQNIVHLPLKSQTRLPFMANSNWLYNYGKIEGIQKSLTGLSKRTNYTNNMDQAHVILLEHEESLQSDFEEFYPQLITFVENELNK